MNSRRAVWAVSATFLAVLAILLFSNLATGSNPLGRKLDGQADRSLATSTGNKEEAGSSDTKSNEPDSGVATSPENRETVACIPVSEAGKDRCPPGVATEFPDEPFIRNAESKRVSWEEAHDWWDHRELLQGKLAEATEVIYALPGKKTSSLGSNSAVVAFYQKGARVDEHSYWRFVDEGGIEVRVTHYAPGSVVPYAAPIWADKQVRVRGHLADLLELRRSEGDGNNWRTIRWRIQQSNGSTLLWQIGNHPNLYSEQQTIDFIERLREQT